MPQHPSADQTARRLLKNLKESTPSRTGPRCDPSLFDSGIVLKLALGRRVEFADPALRKLSAEVLRQAAAAHVRHCHFYPDATPYQVLGLAPEASERAIMEAFRLLMQLVHPDRQRVRGEWPEAFAAQANGAYAILRDADARARFDREASERVARARSAQAAAVAAAAAVPPVPRWPKSGRVMRRPPSPPLLPEWLTEGVGGFVRAHPAAVAFAALIGIAVLMIAAAAWEGREGSLARDKRAPEPLPVATPMRGAPEPTAVAQAQAPIAPTNEQVAPTGNATAPSTTARDGIPPDATRDNGARAANASERSVPAQDSRMPPREVAAIVVAPALERAPPEASVAPAVTAVPPQVSAAQERPAGSAQPAPAANPGSAARGPNTDEIEALFVTFVDSYDRGRLDAIAALFDDDARTDERHGRAEIRRDYDEVFRRSDWRRMRLTRVSWKHLGEVTHARAEAAIRMGWRDGREVEERLAMDIELARRDGRVVITRLSQRAGAP